MSSAKRRHRDIGVQYRLDTKKPFSAVASAAKSHEGQVKLSMVSVGNSPPARIARTCD